jgi:fused signal recognition particle receptor
LSDGRSFRDRLRDGLERTRKVLNTPVEDLVRGLEAPGQDLARVLQTPVEDVVRGRRLLETADLASIEEALIAADLGMPAVAEALEVLRAKSADIARGGLPAMRALLRDEIRKAVERPRAAAAPFSSRPWVVFVVGVNGVGKTTTIGKLAAAWRAEGKTTLLCAADTFRAAAAEQLAVWAERTGSPFHRGAEGTDPSAVLTDALRAARSRGYDAVLVDTAGRLHTKGNLMAELSKMARVADREVPGAPHETLLVLDATVGSNGLAQGREFARAAGVTGLVLTKLDGTAKGGIAVAVVRELGVPVRYVGVGETLEDLVPFDAAAFAEGLIGS